MLATIKRRTAVARDWVGGLTSTKDLAVRHGVHVQTIERDIEAIRTELQKKHEAEDFSAQIIERLEFAIREAANSWEVSKQNTTEIETKTCREDCKKCNGSGFQGDSDDWCDTCDGEGQVEVETVRRKIVGKAGDIRHLAEFRKAAMELAEIMGVIPEKTVKVNGSVDHRHAHSIRLDDDPLSKATPDQLINILEAVEPFRRTGVRTLTVDSEQVEDADADNDTGEDDDLGKENE
jgi:hypothetical protein